MSGSPAVGRPRQELIGSAASLLGGAAAACGGTAALVLTGHRTAAGLIALVAAVLLLAGTVKARAGRRRALLFAELVLDRIFDASILAPLAWVLRSLSVRVSILALIGLGASFVASYERARGRSLGYAGTETVGYRGLRAAILVLALLAGWIESALWAFVALTLSASAIRALNVARQERRSPRSFEANL